MRPAALAMFVALALAASALCVTADGAAASSAAPPPKLPAAISGTYVMLDGTGVAQLQTALSAGLTQVVVEGVGLMSGQVSVTNTSACAWANVTADYTPALHELVSVCQAAVASGRITRVWVGLLTIGPTPHGGEPAMEWTACGAAYAQLQSTAAERIVHALVNASIPDALWSWFIPQEPDLTAMPTTNADCTGDGETNYIAAVAQTLVFTSVRDVLVAPYRLNTTRPAIVAQCYAAFAQCVPELTHVAVQDGVGSYGLPPEHGAEYYRALAAANNALPPNAQGNAIALWATVELFQPLGQLCKAADALRVAKQVAAAAPSVTGMLGFWVFDLPGAPPCPF